MTEKVFDLSALDTADCTEMEVYLGDKPTGWMLRFAGPGHPKSIEQSNRLAKERLRREQAIEQAQINGKKYKAQEESVDEVVERNVGLVVERLIDWSPVKIDGKDFPFSEENARALLKDRKKGQLLIQCLDFLGDEASFMQRSQSS